MYDGFKTKIKIPIVLWLYVLRPGPLINGLDQISGPADATSIKAMIQIPIIQLTNNYIRYQQIAALT